MTVIGTARLTLTCCTRCGQQVDAYEASTVEPGNPAGDRTYYCRPCGQEWPAPNANVATDPCAHCATPVSQGQWHCGSCGHATLAAGTR